MPKHTAARGREASQADHRSDAPSDANKAKTKKNTAKAPQPMKTKTPQASGAKSPKATGTEAPQTVKSARHKAKSKAKGSPLLRMIPIGGMQEIGKNMTVYEFNHDMIIVDCGIAFPDEDMPGVDVVIPDFSYCLENRSRIRGIFITHGHEDHIGALPWLCRDLHVPIYASPLTAALIRLKLDERNAGSGSVDLHIVHDGDRVQAGVFGVEFVHVNHSIADACGLAIRTPIGMIYHSGDFKIDYTPINGGPMDLTRIADIGREGVLLFVCESTNVERKGASPSESKVGETFADIFGKADGRIFVTTFSSNVFRIQQIFTAAEQYGRKVALLGRSMLNYFNAANSLGYINIQPDTLIDLNHMDRYPHNELVVITTGSQGEPMSALSRMAYSEHRKVEIIPGDTVILSSSAIPGNEKSVHRMINELYKRGARVIYESLSEIHVSGHAYQEELKLLHSLIRPRLFVPAHGEFRHLYRHAELAHQMGQAWDHIFLLGNGDILEIDQEKGRIGSIVPAGAILIDGSSKGGIDNQVLRERRLLAEEGVLSVFLALRHNGTLSQEPDLQARGFLYQDEAESVLKECRRRICSFLAKAVSQHRDLEEVLAGDQLRNQLRDLLYTKTQRMPVILISWYFTD